MPLAAQRLSATHVKCCAANTADAASARWPVAPSAWTTRDDGGGDDGDDGDGCDGDDEEEESAAAAFCAFASNPFAAPSFAANPSAAAASAAAASAAAASTSARQISPPLACRHVTYALTSSPTHEYLQVLTNPAPKP